MDFDEKEVEHIQNVIERVREALDRRDAIELRELSDYTLHDATSFQDTTSVTLAILVYSLGKLIERKSYVEIPTWDVFVKKFNRAFLRAAEALENDDQGSYEQELKRARRALETVSPDLHDHVLEVIRKASINKGSKLYEHGISLGQTAKILGLSQWELTDYVGQKKIPEGIKENSKVAVKRAELAMEFFS